MAIWNIIEVFNDKILLSRVRAELAAADFQGITTNEDIEKLTAIPLLQSIYSELLRLRVEVQTLFSSDTEDICINEWRLPKNSLVIVPAGAAHRDPTFWNARDGKYPLDSFWADRFLAYPNDPQSGPRKAVRPTKTKNGIEAARSPRTVHNSNKPRFVSSGLANSYMPYGIGERTCPGRGFARREIVAFCALIVDQFDIEILSKEKGFKVTSAFYGIGTQRPRNKIAFKIRKRQHR
jgi:cytochrome P450